MTKSVPTPVRFDKESMGIILKWMEQNYIENRNLAINDLIHNVGLAVEARYQAKELIFKTMRKHNIRLKELE